VTDSYLTAYRAAKNALAVANQEFHERRNEYTLKTLNECQDKFDYTAKMLADFIENDLAQHGA
ncbi:hypothetical protein O6211_23950, partial [Salmonella enterica subsp. enterica]